MIRPICLVDMDGIVANFERRAIQVYNQKVGTSLDEFNVDKYVGDKTIIDESIDKWIYRKSFQEQFFFAEIPVIENAQEGIRLLSEHFDIYFLTTEYRSNPTCVYEKQQWLETYFPKWADNTIFTKHKNMVYGDILIDDSPMNLQKWSDSWGGLQTVKTASLEYAWINKEITTFYHKDWLKLAEMIIQGFFPQKEELDG
jgi:5'(3')-deoxyribonucleotidase